MLLHAHGDRDVHRDSKQHHLVLLRNNEATKTNVLVSRGLVRVSTINPVLTMNCQRYNAGIIALSPVYPEIYGAAEERREDAGV